MDLKCVHLCLMVLLTAIAIAAAPSSRGSHTDLVALLHVKNELREGLRERGDDLSEDENPDDSFPVFDVFKDDDILSGDDRKDVGVVAAKSTPKPFEKPPEKPPTTADDDVIVTITTEPPDTNTTGNGTHGFIAGVVGFLNANWKKFQKFVARLALWLHVPLWVAYLLSFLVILLAFIILLCCCCCCCCRGKDKKKKGKKRRVLKDIDYSMEGDDFFAPFGRLEYTLEYDTKKKTLTVGIVQVTDIPGVDGGVDPYFRLYIDPKPEGDKKKKRETKVKKKSSNPVFNETFKIKIKDYNELPQYKLKFEMYDWDWFARHTMLGRYERELKDIDLQLFINQSYEETVNLQEGDLADLGCGDICISFRYAPVTAKLILNVLEAKNLKVPGYPDSLPNPYVVAKFNMGGKKVVRKRTVMRHKTRDPYFNEDIIFDAPDVARLVSCSVMITVKHKSPVMKMTSKLGYVVLSDTSGNSEKMHWRDAISNPRHSVARWHVLKDPRGAPEGD